MKKYALKLVALTSSLTDGQVFIGADVAKKDMVLAVVVRRPDGSLEILERRTIGSTQAAVASQVRRFPGAQWVYEAGPTGYRLLFWLKELGAKAFMTPPSLLPVASGDRVKTNARDAVKLATLAAGGQLKKIQELSEEQYADRSLVRGRRQSVEARSDIARQIKSELLFHGMPIKDLLDAAEGEEVSEDVTKRLLEALRNLSTGHLALDERLKLDADRYATADVAVHQYDQAVKRLALAARFTEPRKLLMSIPGVGVISAMEILVERGGSRFESGSKFASYTGLTPGEHSTGDSTRRGRITRCGNARLRTTLVEAAWRVRRGDEWAAGIYDAVLKRNGGKEGAGKKAIVAVAHQLAVAIHAMLRDKKCWMEHAAAKKAA